MMQSESDVHDLPYSLSVIEFVVVVVVDGGGGGCGDGVVGVELELDVTATDILEKHN